VLIASIIRAIKYVCKIQNCLVIIIPYFQKFPNCVARPREGAVSPLEGWGDSFV
jgi:hypothetical protein